MAVSEEEEVIVLEVLRILKEIGLRKIGGRVDGNVVKLIKGSSYCEYVRKCCAKELQGVSQKKKKKKSQE